MNLLNMNLMNMNNLEKNVLYPIPINGVEFVDGKETPIKMSLGERDAKLCQECRRSKGGNMGMAAPEMVLKEPGVIPLDFDSGEPPKLVYICPKCGHEEICKGFYLSLQEPV